MGWLLEKFFLIRNYDWFLTIVVFILAGIGLISIYSVDLSLGEELLFFPTQVAALVMGAVLFFAAGTLHVTFYQYSARLFYLLSLVLLVAVLFFGTTIRGTTGWFRLAGYSFQPVEFAKLSLIIFLAYWIERHGRRFDRWQFVFTSALITLVPVTLTMLQPDLGSAIIMMAVWFLMLLFTGTKKRYIASLAVGAILVAFLSWTFVLADYQKDRLRIFLNPELDPLGAGYNVSQSIIAIGAGGFFGRGLGFGSQSQLHFLPEAQTDFIFSVIAEELGFVVVLIVMSLYFLMLWRLALIAKHGKNDFAAYLTVGVFLLFLIQIVLNIGGSAGLLPVTGITLPFLSYGGSSLIINFLLIGMAQSIFRSSRK